MDKIVSLCRRRGFVFPSSEIYGGLGSTYDYGHYGVLAKNNIRSAWFHAMVQERDDIVALDSAIILNPRVWEASGHVAGFTDPLVDCRTCKLRFRADQLDQAQCGKRPSKRPGEHTECDLTEARQFNLMFETQVGALEGDSSRAYLRPETAQGIFINFKNVSRSRGGSRRSESRRSASRSATRSRRATSSSACASSSRWRWSSSCRPTRRRRGTAFGSTRVTAGIWTWGCASRTCASASTARRSARTIRAAPPTRVPVPDRLVGARGNPNRGDFDLTQHTEHSTTKLEYVGAEGERYTPHVVEPAVSIDRFCSRSSSTAMTRRPSPDASGRCFACTRASRRSRRRSSR